MTSYTRLNVSELKELCKNYGISPEGRKADLIAALIEKDKKEAERRSFYSETADGEEEVEDNDVEIRVAQSQEDVTESAKTDSNEILLLKLQLELAKENRLALEIKERMEANPGTLEGGATSKTVFGAVERELRGLLPKMSDRDEDAVSFFHAFERTLELYDVDSSCYSRLLPGCLSMKASKVYSKLSLEQSRLYETVKREILASFKLDAASYIHKFRTVKRSGSESYKMFSNRLQELQTYYFESKDINSFERLKCDMLLEQFVSTLPPAIKSFVLARRPANIGEASDFADLAFQVSQEREHAGRGGERTSIGLKKFSDQANFVQNHTNTSSGERQINDGLNVDKKPITCFECSGPHKKAQCPKLKDKTGGNGVTKIATCFTCGEKGHKSGSPLCKGKVGQTLRESYFVNKTRVNKKDDNNFVIPTFVNGVECEALRDTGASCTLINVNALNNRVKPMVGRHIMIQGVTGQKRVPVAKVQLYSPHFKCDKAVTILAGLVNDMKYDVLLGNDLFDEQSELTDVISVNRVITADSEKLMNNRREETCKPVHAVTTRSQANKGLSKVTLDTKNSASSEEEMSDSEVELDTTNKGSKHLISEQMVVKASHADSYINDMSVESTANEDMLMSRSLQDRMVSNDSTLVTDPVDRKTRQPDASLNPIANASLCASTELENRVEFAKMQQQDSSLSPLFKLAQAGSDKYFIENGILYRRAIGGCNVYDDKLLCVPSCFREKLVRTAHDSMWSAHSGVRRTAQRVSALFFFPRMHSFIASWVRKCPVCQRLAPIKKRDRAPLNETPVIGEVFADISVDICGGDWPLTQRRNRYLLTAICNTSKFAFAIPVPNLRAKTLAGKLMKLFSSIGLPKTLRLDSAAQWRGSLIQELTKALGVACNIATPFHHESIGTLERFHATLERMAKSFIHDSSIQWDVAIDYYLFAYNSVKSATTGHSPQELVFGRNLRSPLNVMREVWLNGEPEHPKLGKDVLSYLTELKEQLEAAAEAAEAETLRKHERYKTHYDRKTTVRQLREGDLVLVLQPTSSFKLLAQWAGPYPVTRKLSTFNYEIDLGHRKTILHINLLRKWEERLETVNVITVNDDLIEGEETLLDAIDTTKQPKIFNVGNHLSAEQAAEMYKLFDEFPDVFTDKIGCTDLVQHVISLKDSEPCVQPPYKVPEALRQEVQREIERLLAQGIITESDSNFCAPLVFVRRAGSGKIRICGDWRKLNQKTVDDPYLMNNPAEILSRAAGAKFISTIDLNSAYYQVPLEEKSRKYTAFRCFCGTFEFLRGGFGLKNMPKTFQKLINKILRGCEDFAEAHLDDIAIYSNTFEEHVMHVRQVLTRLRNAGLTANTAKCKFLLERIKILGHVIENGVLRPDDDKVEAIKRISNLKTKTEVKSFLGLTGYYADFIPKYQEKAFALTELLKRNKPDKIQWGEAEQKALDALKTVLISKPVLAPPDPSRPYILQTDASRIAISAILCQKDVNGKEHVISYASRKLLPRETKYSVIELELLAVVFGVIKFNHYLYGRKIELQSDHRPLSYISALLEHSPRLARWNLILSCYDITPTFKKGIMNSNADGLSRL